MKILLSGGGTLGPAVPLLAIVENYRKIYPEAKFIWVGTKDGPEKELVNQYQIPFFAIPAGKWRRYFSWENFIDIFRTLAGFFDSLILLQREQPDLLISVGGYVSAPLHWAAMILRKQTWVHQQDVRVGLSNRLMAWGASKITTALQMSLKYFSQKKTEWIGNPVRDLKVENYLASKSKFGIPERATVILAMGGGTGADKVNQLVVEALAHWPADWHVIHLVGKERSKDLVVNAVKLFPNYHAYDFLTEEMKDAYAAADVVISRAGFASLTELALLKKAAVIIPMPDTHQEDNVRYLAKEKAVVYFDQRTAKGLQLARQTRELLEDMVGRDLMAKRLHEILPPAKSEKIVEIINRLIKK